MGTVHWGSKTDTISIASVLDRAGITVIAGTSHFGDLVTLTNLALVLESESDPVVVLTKSDLHEDPASLRQIAESLHPGLIVETLDARDALQASTLNDWCGKGKTVAMLGSSGVGKSTLANAMCDVAIKTASIREDDAKGRHTTTARAMHR